MIALLLCLKIIVTRGSDRRSISDRIQVALREHEDLRGACALNASSPVIVAEFRSARVAIKMLLERNYSACVTPHCTQWVQVLRAPAHARRSAPVGR